MISKFTDNEDFLDSYVQDKKDLAITCVTNEYADMAYNWFLSLKNVKMDHLAVVVALDVKCYEFLLSKSVPCVLLDYKIDKNQTYEQWKKNEKYIKSDAPFYMASKYKTNTIHSEVDIIFLKNPIEKLKIEASSEYDLLCVSDKRFDMFTPNRNKDYVVHIDKIKGEVTQYEKTYQSKYGIENFGFSYHAYNENTLNFWRNLLSDSSYIKKFPDDSEEGNIQTILIKAIREFDIRVKVLNPYEFVNGMLWQIPYLRKKVQDKCYIIHYNGLDGNSPLESKQLKIDFMRKFGHWYVE